MLNNPLKYTDPSGHFVIAVPLVWIAGAAIVTYFVTPPGQAAIKTITNSVVNTSKMLSSAVSNVIKSATTAFSSKSASPPSTGSPRTASSGGNSPQKPNGIIAGAAGAASALSQKAEVHGNSIKSTAQTVGYYLRDKVTDSIIKIGETINPNNRYPAKYLEENNAYLDRIEVGTKGEMRIWEHEGIGDYIWENGEPPALNIQAKKAVNVFR